jgi:quercetin dioxygenase-like cupin family protein
MKQPSRYLKLPFSFDLVRLQQELAMLQSAEWVSHFNTHAYEKNWTCLPLRSVDGRLDHIMPVESSSFQDTPILARCPYLREVIDSFQCEKTSVRLMAMDPGAVIKEHRDEGTALEDGITRLHIPIQTAPQVLFRIDGEEVHFSAGDTWYLNASCLHAVENRSHQSRVHLMLDCISNAWLEETFLAAGWVPRVKSIYPDPSVNDSNVQQVIEQLRANGLEAGLRLADQLQAIRSGQPADVGL